MRAIHRLVRAAGLLAPLALAAACGVEGQESEGGDHTVFRSLRSDLAENRNAKPDVADPASWDWPDGERPHAFVEVAGVGTIEIELYPELAPTTVANFEKLASQAYYDGTTFHRVIPGFMIQGGDPNTRDDDPRNDGQGSPGYTIEDEFTKAPHVRGAVAMANRGSPNTAGGQFFIVHADSQHLDHAYTLFGRVVDGLDVVDAIAATETDTTGRWGPKDRPIADVRMERVWVASPRTLAALRAAETSEAPDGAASGAQGDGPAAPPASPAP